MKTGNVTTNVNIPGGVGGGQGGGQGGGGQPQAPGKPKSWRQQKKLARQAGKLTRIKAHHEGGGYLGKLKRGIARTGQAGMAAGGNTGANA